MPPKKKQVDKTFSVEKVADIFQQVHKSAAHIPQCKRELLAFFEADQEAVARMFFYAVLLVLKESSRLPPDVLGRHYSFVTEFCKECRAKHASDKITVTILRAVMRFHNANDKAVRLGVVSLIEALLRAVDPSNDSNARQELHDELAEIVKLRLYDKFHSVRERAVCCASYFQVGKKTCDMTQQLLVLLCTDNCADVRRQILQNVRDRVEFVHGYFSSMIRCLDDVVARVRAAAWDALCRTRWEVIVACADMKRVNLSLKIKRGLADASKKVSDTCRAVLTEGWLHRDNGDNCEAMLQALISREPNCEDLEAIDVFCTEILKYCRRHNNSRRYTVDFGCMSAASLFLWKTSVKLSAGAEGDDELDALLPLAQFSVLFKDTINIFAHPEKEPETVKYTNVEEADIMLRCLLSALDIYQEEGYLAHSDNTTRGCLLRHIGFLLKIFSDDNPALFVDAAMRTLKALTERTPEEASKTITSALASLFVCLKLPRRYSLGYDDVEAFGQKNRERQNCLKDLRIESQFNKKAREEYERLKEEMSMDEKYLLRMQHIVFAFLSHSRRGEAIPSFCSHIIQLGRRLDNGAVRAISTKSLGLQCLVNPEAVHTFMPLIMSDASDVVTEEGECVSLAALGVVFDLVMEYGLRFFDHPTSTSDAYDNHSRSIAMRENSGEEDDAAAPSLVSGRAETDVEARLQYERALAQEDEHKVGGGNLLFSLRAFMGSADLVRSTMAVIGFSKLLSCNRVYPKYVPEIIADILLHLVVHRQGKTKHCSEYMIEYITKFFGSYASSHDQRQFAFAQGGVLTFIALLRSRVPLASWLIEFVTRLSEPSTLVQVRNIDLTAARQTGRVDDEPMTEGGDQVAMSNMSSGRSTSIRYSTQSSQVRQVMSKYSLHEFIASELLIEMAQNESEDAREVCMVTLEKRMSFYAKTLPSWLVFCCDRAIDSVSSASPLHHRLVSWWDEVTRRLAAPINTETQETLTCRWRETLERRDRAVKSLLDSDIVTNLIIITSPAASSSPTGEDCAASGANNARKRTREPKTVFEKGTGAARRRKAN